MARAGPDAQNEAVGCDPQPGAPRFGVEATVEGVPRRPMHAPLAALARACKLGLVCALMMLIPGAVAVVLIVIGLAALGPMSDILLLSLPAGLAALYLVAMGIGLLRASRGLRRGEPRARTRLVWLAGINGFLGALPSVLVLGYLALRMGKPEASNLVAAIPLGWAIPYWVCWASARARETRGYCSSGEASGGDKSA